MHPAKIQIILDIRLVWSEIYLSAQWEAKYSGIPHASSENSDHPRHPVSLIRDLTERSMSS